MIHRIEPGYLRTQDSLSKRDRRPPRRRYVPRDEREDETRAEETPHLEEGQHSIALDLVA